MSARRLAAVLRKLALAHGPAEFDPADRPVERLVRVLLSQRTHATNARVGYARLRKRFGSWRAVADAPAAEVEQAIGVCGFGATRAATLQKLLAELRRRFGRATLAPLRRLGEDEAREALRSLPGVGPDSAEIVLLRSLGHPVMPVDAGIHRLARRLGLAPPGADREEVRERLIGLTPPPRRHACHVLLHTHARLVCHATRPDCAACALRRSCPHGRGERRVVDRPTLAARPGDGIPDDER